MGAAADLDPVVEAVEGAEADERAVLDDAVGDARSEEQDAVASERLDCAPVHGHVVGGGDRVAGVLGSSCVVLDSGQGAVGEGRRAADAKPLVDEMAVAVEVQVLHGHADPRRHQEPAPVVSRGSGVDAGPDHLGAGSAAQRHALGQVDLTFNVVGHDLERVTVESRGGVDGVLNGIVVEAGVDVPDLVRLRRVGPHAADDAAPLERVIGAVSEAGRRDARLGRGSTDENDQGSRQDGSRKGAGLPNSIAHRGSSSTGLGTGKRA